jgi:sorbitol-specific phosphotransferase system component IIBC
MVALLPARPYHLDPHESPIEHAKLMKEVMDSSFLSAAKKAEYCEQLAPIAIPEETQQPPTSTEVVDNESRRLAEYREKAISMLSVVMGVLTAIATAFTVSSKLVDTLWETAKRQTPVLVLVSLIILIMIGTAIMFSGRITTRKSERLRNNREHGDESSDEKRAGL